MQLVDFLWSLLVIFFMIMYFMMLFWVIVDVFRDHEMNGWAKAAWLIFLLVIPVLALLIYVIVRGPSMAKRQAEEAQRIQAAQQQYVDQLVKNSGGAGASATDQIAEAKKLLDSGAITQQEFDALKAKALAS